VTFTADGKERLVEVPFVPWLCATPFEPSGVLAAELRTPAPHGLIAQLDTALKQQLFDRPERQAEAVVELQAVTDDLSWKAVAFVGAALHKPLP
jgi:hypothetical protein